MKQFLFLDWKVYADGQNLFTQILGLVKKLPSEYRFELGNQIVRSALSIILNICEGSGKESKKEFGRYIEISLGSAYETLASVDTMKRNGFITNHEFEAVSLQISSICNQLGGLKKSLGKSGTEKR